MTILCYHAKNASVILASGKEQQIFRYGKALVAGSPELAEIVKWLSRDTIKSIEESGISAYVLDRDSCKKIHHKTVSNVEGFDCLGKIGKRPEVKKTLEEITYALYSCSKQGSLQLALADRHGNKALFAPDVGLVLPPEEYLKRGVFSHERSQANAEFYRLLLNSLVLLKKNEKSDGRISRFMSRMKLLDDTKGIINRYLDYGHGLLERGRIAQYFSRAQETQATIGKKAYNVKKSTDLQTKLDNELLPKSVRSMIIEVGGISSFFKKSGDYAEKLNRELGMLVRPFHNFRYISIRGDRKDIEKLYHKVKRPGLFGIGTKDIFRNIRSVNLCHGKYIPELFGIEDIGVRKARGYHVTSDKKLWNLENINAYAAQNMSDGSGARIAVIDTGVDYTHGELRENFGAAKGYDFVRNTSDPMDLNGHGTHVAGTIAGKSTGVAPYCSISALRVLDENGSGLLDDILLAVDWCMSNNMDALNMSLGSPSESQIEREVFWQAYEKGLLSVAAAGNESYGASFPAAYDSVIAVAAVDRFNAHAPFSNIWYTNNVSAPGVGILSCLPGNDYGTLNGTSMATPHVTGCAALYRSAGLDTQKDEFQASLERTSLKLGEPGDADSWAKFGAGLVQADRLVNGESLWKRMIS